jgi:chromosome segregation ATPase
MNQYLDKKEAEVKMILQPMIEDISCIVNPFHEEKYLQNEETTQQVNEWKTKYEEMQDEYQFLKSEWMDLKTDMQIQKDKLETHIAELESAKIFLNQIIDNTRNEKEYWEKNAHLVEYEKEELKKENTLLIQNNQQLQYELVHNLKHSESNFV